MLKLVSDGVTNMNKANHQKKIYIMKMKKYTIYI